MALFAILLVAAAFITTASSQNITYLDGVAGSEATLLSIGSIHQSGVFGDDKELLRRIAYTATRDGTQPDTYRAGYHGGIWAVDEDQFLKTKNTTLYTRLPARLQQIELRFGINWLDTQWVELRKPIYSAIAARLVLYIAPASIPSADDLPSQAQFWVAHYNRNGDASAFVTTSSGLQGSILESAANEFFLGFTINYQAGYFDALQFFISTPEPSLTRFSVSASGYSYNGTATNHSTTVVNLPRSLEVTSNTQRNKGIRVKAEGERKIVVYGISYEQFTTDAFLALPCSNLAVDTYEYYGITYSSRDMSDILLVGCEDQTVVTTPTTTFTLNRQETYLITRNDVTGYRVTSTKPLSFFSNHRCTNVPSPECCCDFLTEQLPPTFTWGRAFFVASLLGRTSGELFKIITSQSSTVVRIKCTSLSQDLVYNLANAGNWQEFQISSNSFCSIESSSPLLVMQFSLANARDGVGDPFMTMIPPVEQYSNNYVLNVLSSFSTNYITIYVAAKYYQPQSIIVDNTNQRNAIWTAVRCVNNSICGYITRVSLAAGEHRLYHQDPEARVGVSAYGFNNYNSYGYSGGLKLTPIQLATVSLEAASYSVPERQGVLQINITRSGNLQNTSVILVATDDFQGTASVRQDYTSVSQIVEFLPGQTEKHILVQINDDMKIEDNETFSVYLIAGAGVTLTPISRTEITIENDDGMITLTPSYGSMLGGTGVIATGEGLLVSESDVITCLFDEIGVRGVFINSEKVLCVSPLLEKTGKVQFMLNISGSNGGESVFTSLSYTKCYGVYLENDDLLFSNETLVNVRWSPFSIFSMELPHIYNVDISLLELNLTTGTWSELLLISNLSNTGYAGVSIPRLEESITLEGIISPIVISVGLSQGRGSSRILTDLAQFSLKTSQNAPVRFLRKSTTLVMQGLCTSWSNQQPTNIGQDILNLLPPCPLRLRDVVAINSGYFLETFASISPVAGDIPARVGNLVCEMITSNISQTVIDDKYKEYFHPDIANCYRLRRTDLGGYSQQCCYNNNGFLITGPPGGGNVDRMAPDLRLLGHFIEDVIPYLLCCKAQQFSKCRTFYEKRPSDRGFDFSPPRPPARARTDPHMVTFDGHQYTFNGKGEYVLIETPDNSFSLQGRMLPISTAQNTSSPATVYKAIVGKQNDSDTVQFEIIEGCNFIALVNGEQVVFGLINQQEFNNVVVSYLGNNTFSASFSSGAYVEAKEEVGMISVVSVSLPVSFQEIGTQGLMGSFNGNITDDLLPQSGHEPLSLNSSVRDVHEQFGITWIVDSPLDSLFTYQPGETWATFYDPYFVPIYRPVFSDNTLEQQATMVCGTDLECLFDMAATGRMDIGQVSVEIEQEIEEILQLQIPVVCQNPCAFGACVANNTCHCEPGYTGSNCSTPVFTACEQNPCQFGGTCTRHGLNNICNCPPATSGDFCEIDLDIDECALGQHQCHPVAMCTNTRGSYFCTCPSGSSGNGFNCTDLCNECTGVPLNCGTHNCNTTTSDCTNTIGGFQCTCRFGSDGGSCASPPRPNPPTSVSVISVGITTIAIMWTEPSVTNNISVYNLVLTEFGGSVTSVSVPAGTNSYNFTSLEEYRNYTCTIAATSIYGAMSVTTTPISARTLETTPSASPENFNAVSGSSTSASISWEPPPEDDVNGVIIQYIINVTIVGSGETFLLYSTTTSLNVTNLRPYTTYVCVIAAVTSVGMGPFGSEFVLQTPQSSPSSPPQSVQLSSISSTSIDITWSPPPSSDINGVISEYHIIITEVITGRTINLTSPTTSVIAFGLHPYYVYNCIISAYTVENGPYSQAINITTPENVPSGSPLTFGGNATSSRSASISWSPPPADQWNGIITRYIINVTVEETGHTFQLNSTTTTLRVNSLQPYRNYTCIIAAVTSVGIGPFSGSFTLITPQDVPTMSPQNPAATTRDSRTIVFSWNPPPFEHQNGRIIEYRINVTEVITGRVFLHMSTSTSYVNSSLHPDYVYEWTVTAVTIGVGPYTTASNIRTPEDVPTAPPQSLGVNNLSSETIEISWQPPPLPDRNGVIIGYIINITSLDSGVIQQLTTTLTTLYISNLSPFTSYSCLIAARTAIGIGPFSTVFHVQTLEAAPGSHPSNFTGASLNSTHVHLTWDPPPPSQINGIIREYRLNVTEDATGAVFQYTTNASIQEITIGPLHPYYIYHCSVVAYTVEQGPYTSIFAIQTEEDIPSGPPTNFVTAPVDSRTVNLTWSPPVPQEQNGILRYYVVIVRSALSTETRNISSTQTSIAITGLRPYTLYNCTVSVGTVGLGPATIIRQIITPQDVPTGPPQNFTVSVNTSRSLTLYWTPPLPLEANGIVTDYTINVTSSIGINSFQIGSNANTYTLTSLRPYVRYTCLVAAHTIIGQGPFSIRLAVTTPEESPEAPPVNIIQSVIMSQSVTLSWMAPQSDRQNGIIRHYLVEAYENTTGNVFTYQTPSDQTSFVVSNLHPYYTYTVRIQAVTIGPGPLSAAFAVITAEDIPTAAPLIPSGSAFNSTFISIAWSPPPAEHINGVIDLYTIEVTEVVTSATWLFYATDTQVHAGPLHPFYMYRCRVSASTIGPGPYTAFFYVTSGEAVPVGAPANLLSTQTTTSSLTLAWDPPPLDQQNGMIRYYTVYIMDITNGTSWDVRVNATGTTIQNLNPFFTYNCSVAAYTVATGPISYSITVRLPQAAPSVPAANVRGFAPDHSSIVLEWDSPPVILLNGVLTAYIIRVTERETGLMFEHNTNDTSITLDSLHPHYIYECRVAARTIATGPFSTVFAVQVLMAAPSSTPENVTTTALSSTSIEIIWDPPLPHYRNGPITAYNITVIEQLSRIRALSLVVFNTTSLVVTSLRPFTTYNFIVSARNSIGYGPSTTLSHITPEDTPSAPTNFEALAIPGDPLTLIFSWDSPLNPNGLITHYNVYCQESQEAVGSGDPMLVLAMSSSSAVFACTILGSDYNTTITGLTPFTNYGCYISANTSIGEGNISTFVFETTDEYIPYDPPMTLQVAALNASAISLTWSPPLIPYGNIVSYTILVENGIVGGNVTTLVVNSSLGTNYSVSNLLPFTYYNFSVAASTRIGMGPFGTISTRTPQDRPSGFPTSVVSMVSGASTANISWAPPDPNLRHGIIIYYTVLLTDLTFGMSQQVYNTTLTAINFTGLEEYATYACEISGATIAGLGPFSSPVQFTTFEDVPSAPPQNFNGSALSSSVIMLAWSLPPPTEINGVIDHYIVNVVERHTGRQWTFVVVDQMLHVGGLHPHYYYDSNVSAVTISTGPYSATYSILTQPEAPIAAPQQLSVTRTSTSITLSWNPPPFEDSNGFIQYYTIQVTDLDTNTTLPPIKSYSTEYTVNNLHPYYVYQCTVAAYTTDNGPYTPSITVQLSQEAPTSPPLELSGFARNSDSIYLSWSPPAVSGRNGLIQHYLVNVTEVDTGTMHEHLTSKTNITLFSLHPYYMYSITVTAVTIAPGPPSSPIIIITDSEVPSQPPQQVSASIISSDEVMLRWEAPNEPDRNGIIISYLVNITLSNAGLSFTRNSTNASLTLNNLRPFTSYICHVAARTEVGLGPLSTSISFLTGQAAPSAAPENVSLQAISSTAIELSWTPPQLEIRNGIITEYRISLLELDTEMEQVYTALMTSFVIQSLHPYYTYHINVSAHTVLTGPYSTIQVIQMPEDIPSGFPQSFTEIVDSSRSINFNWQAPPVSEQNGIIISYTINVTETRSRHGLQQMVHSSQPSITVTTLLPFTTYSCSIAASTSVGIGPFSTLLIATTLEDVPDMSPSNLTGLPQDSTTIILYWDEPEGRHNGIIQEYRLNITEVETGQFQHYTSSTTNLVVDNLHPYYTYLWTVAAVTVGEGPYSVSQSVTTLEDVPSGPPTNFSGSSTSSSSIFLSWNQPVPEDRNGDITGYVINVTNLDNETVHQFTTGLTSSLIVPNLQPFTFYECTVFARTAVGIGQAPAMVITQTNEDAPGSHPLNSSGYAINSTHIALNWSAPHMSDLNGILREYRINVTEAITLTLMQFTTSSDTTEIIIGPLHPFYIYHCTILAYTIEGGPTTNIISVRTHEDAPSGPPTTVSANATSSRSVSLSWGSPTQDQQNGIIRYYLVIVKSNIQTFLRNISSTQHTISIPGLRPYTIYNCTVQAETIQLGPPSVVIQVNTPQDVPNGPPRYVIAHTINSSTLNISWESPAPEHHNGLIQRYSINLTEIETGMSQLLSTIEETILVSNLHPYYRYGYSVAAVTIGQGVFSVASFVRMPEAAPASPPTDVQITEVTSTSFLVSWTDPMAIYHNGIIRSYIISVTEENTGRQIILTSHVNNQRIDSIHPYYNYTCEVAAVTIIAGPYSRPVAITTAEAVPSGLPRNLMTQAFSSTSIILSWDSPLIHERNGIITNYTITLTLDGTSTIFTTTTTTLTVVDLYPFTSYTFNVSASTNIGIGPASSSVTETTLEYAPDGPPLNVSFSEVTSTSLILTWLPPLNPNGMILHYIISLLEVNTGTNLTYQAHSHSFFSVGDLHPSYSYLIRVFAVTIEMGPPSLNLMVTTLEDIPSAAPTAIAALAVDPRNLLVNWALPPMESQNGIITEYVVRISAQETGEYFQHSTQGSSSSLTIEGLHPDYNYVYTVAAATGIGRGPFSEFYSLRMPEDVPTAAPSNASASVINSTAIIVTWELPPLDGRNGNITGYSLVITEVATNTTTTHSQSGLHVELVITSLHPYYEYECQIAAETAVGRGPYGDAIITRTLPDVPSGTPINVRIIEVTSRAIDVVWDPVPAHQQNGPILLYAIVLEDQEAFTTLTLNATSTFITISNLHPSYNYSIEIAAVTTSVGPFSRVITIKTSDDAPTGPPIEVTATTTSSTSITISWRAPLSELQNGDITSYYIYIVELETGQVLNFTTEPTDNSYIVNNLHPFYYYNCSVSAYTNGLGPSAHFTVQTLSDEPSLPPRNIVTDVLNATTVVMSWMPPLQEGQNGFIQSYNVRVIGVHTNENYSIAISSTELFINNLHPFYSYTFSVAAETISQGPFSEPVTIAMPTSAPQSAVRNVTTEILSPTSVRLQWLPESHDGWNGIITNYTIEYSILHQVSANEQSDGFVMTFAINIATGQLRNNPDPILATNPLMWEEVDINGLEPYFVYSFSVYYENSAGLSPKSSTIETSLPYTVPSGPPTDVSVMILSQTSILIRWNTPEVFEQNGPIVGYKIVLTYTNGTSSVYNSPHPDIFNLQIEGLAKFLNLNITIAAKTPAGVGPPSLPIFVNRTSHDSIESPSIVQAKVIDKINVDLVWSHPNDLSDILLDYQIIYFGYKSDDIQKVPKHTDGISIVDGPHIVAISGKTTRYLIKDLQSGLTYLIIVQVTAATGFKANSTEVTVVIMEDLVATEAIVSSAASLTPIIIAIAVIGGIILIVIVLVIAVFVWRRKPTTFNINKGVQSQTHRNKNSEVELEVAESSVLKNYTAKDGEEYDDVDEKIKGITENEMTFL